MGYRHANAQAQIRAGATNDVILAAKREQIAIAAGGEAVALAAQPRLNRG
jgi:hypothetical protein